MCVRASENKQEGEFTAALVHGGGWLEGGWHKQICSVGAVS
jgi:hypothetical protein